MLYHVYFAIYRREFNRQGSVQYQQQHVITLSRFVSGFVTGLDEEFSCTTLSIIPAIRIQEGDIIGACLPRINSLDVVSDISNEEGLNANLSYI